MNVIRIILIFLIGIIIAICSCKKSENCKNCKLTITYEYDTTGMSDFEKEIFAESYDSSAIDTNLGEKCGDALEELDGKNSKSNVSLTDVDVYRVVKYECK